MSLTLRKYPFHAVGVLEDGGPVVVPLSSVRDFGRPWRPLTVWVSPADGDTVSVEYRVDASGPWQEWPTGDVTAYADDSIESPASDLRFTRIAGGGTTSAFGVM